MTNGSSANKDVHEYATTCVFCQNVGDLCDESISSETREGAVEEEATSSLGMRVPTVWFVGMYLGT